MERKYSINQSELLVRFGNILESKAEIMVSSDDNYLTMEGGVSQAILNEGGDEIKQDAKKKVPAQLGEVVVTTSGKMPQKYIFHCVTLKNNNGKRIRIQEEEVRRFIIRHSVEKCLRMMTMLGVDTIAFPTIGAGSAHIPFETVALHMAEVITEFLTKTNKRYVVEIYLYDRYQKMEWGDYIVFFENVARSIDRAKENNSQKQEFETLDEGVSIIQPDPFGDMAVPNPSIEHKVFVSYSRKDMDLARVFCEKLDQMKISYWIDVQGKYCGANYKSIMVDAIESSKLLLFLSSKNSNESVYVMKENGLAATAGIPILPILLDDSPYAKSIRFDLSDVDRIEYFENNQQALIKFDENIRFHITNPSDEH